MNAENLEALEVLATLACLVEQGIEATLAATSRRWWVRPINARRQNQGAVHNLIREMRFEDDESFFNFTRLSFSEFDELLHLVGPSLEKCSIRASISPESRLLLTLRYLATSDSFWSLHYIYRIGHSTVAAIVHETCREIYFNLKDLCMPRLTLEKLEKIAEDFEGRTKYPHIIGAIDGKHVTIKAPPKSGTYFFNYKKQFSIVLLGVCDAQYRFIYFSVGGYGSESDGGVFRSSSLFEEIENGEFPFPVPRSAHGSSFHVPYLFLGDAAFPLRSYLMTPYCRRNLEIEQINHNRELSKGRCLIENTFGILTARWQIFSRAIQAKPENVGNIVLASIMLHNFILSSQSEAYLNNVDEAIASSRSLQAIPPSYNEGARNATAGSRELRNKIKDLINNL